jgi:lactate dehydrogenase-like 2-hydroxyacid dehydrogenase
VDAEVLQLADSLKVVATMSVGYDHLDIATLKEKGIKVVLRGKPELRIRCEAINVASR